MTEPVFDEYFFGKVAAHAFADELQKLQEGQAKLAQGLLPKSYLQKAKQVGQLAKKTPTAVPPLKGALGAAKQYISRPGKPKI